MIIKRIFLLQFFQIFDTFLDICHVMTEREKWEKEREEKILAPKVFLIFSVRQMSKKNDDQSEIMNVSSFKE